MAAGETFKASVIGELSDGTAVVFDFGYADMNAGSEHIDTSFAAGQFQTLVQDDMAACLPSVYTFKRYRFACTLGAHLGEVGYVEVDPPVIGSLDGVDRLPNEMAIGLKRSTGHTSRRDRGRVFFGPVCQEMINSSNGNKPATTASDLIVVRDKLKANLVLDGYVLRPVILAADGTFSGRTIINVGFSPTLIHRKSRRPRTGA